MEHKPVRYPELSAQLRDRSLMGVSSDTAKPSSHSAVINV